MATVYLEMKEITVLTGQGSIVNLMRRVIQLWTLKAEKDYVKLFH